ncbi:MAG: hypothetical protein P4L83_00245 [Nevskia sp.]|nr:hypothetical protein [Nevskia sp.]
MNKRRRADILCCALLLCATASAGGHGLTSEQGCNRLKAVIARQRSAPHGAAEYRCDLDPTEGASRYYVFALRSNFPAPPGAGPDWVGSALVDWFAVSKSSGEISEWDVGEEAIGKKVGR